MTMIISLISGFLPLPMYPLLHWTRSRIWLLDMDVCPLKGAKMIMMITMMTIDERANAGDDTNYDDYNDDNDDKLWWTLTRMIMMPWLWLWWYKIDSLASKPGCLLFQRKWRPSSLWKWWQWWLWLDDDDNDDDNDMWRCYLCRFRSWGTRCSLCWENSP